MEYMLFSTEKYNFFQSRNPGIWALPIPGFGIPGLQSLHTCLCHQAVAYNLGSKQADHATYM